MEEREEMVDLVFKHLEECEALEKRRRSSLPVDLCLSLCRSLYLWICASPRASPCASPSSAAQTASHV